MIRIDGKDYHIKTRWTEFTYSEFCEVVKASEFDFMNKLSVYTSIPFQVLKQCSVNQISVLCGLVGWMEDYENCLLFVKDYKDDLSIGGNTYEKIERAKVILQGGKPLLALGGLVELYYGEDISNVCCIDSMGKGLHVLTKIDEFLKRYKELFEYEPTPEELEAGVEDLGKLGSFYTVKKLSEKYHKHPDEILKWEAAVAYSILQADAIDSRISRNLQKIYSRKTK